MATLASLRLAYCLARLLTYVLACLLTHSPRMLQVMDMSQQEVDDDSSSAAAEQRDAIHRFHIQNAPSRQARRLTRGLTRNNIELGLPQIDISLDADALQFECEQGANHEQHVTLRNTGSASMLTVPCRLARATARHPGFLGLALLTLSGAPHSGGAAVPPPRAEGEAGARYQPRPKL